jgi:uncharacterized protein with FMN-binding domain
VRKNMKWLESVLLVPVFLVLFSCDSAEVKAVRAMPINHVDLTQVKDGKYPGSFTYGGFRYEVEVEVANHQIKNTTVTKNRTASHAQKAEGVMNRILEQQRNDVDVVSGATTTSKALLKAVENALEGKE